MIKTPPKQAPEYNVLALYRHYLYLAGLSKQNQQNGLASVVVRSHCHGSKLAKHPLCALLASTLHLPKQHQHQQFERDQDHHG